MTVWRVYTYLHNNYLSFLVYWGTEINLNQKVSPIILLDRIENRTKNWILNNAKWAIKQKNVKGLLLISYAIIINNG